MKRLIVVFTAVAVFMLFAVGAAPVALAAPPMNDAFSAAQMIAGASGTVATNNLGATKQAGEPNHGGNPGGASVWFKWTAPQNGRFTFDTTTDGVYSQNWS